MKSGDPFEYQLLRKLAEKYRKSKKDSGESAVKRASRVYPKELYGKYHDNDADLSVIREIGEAISDNIGRGFVRARQEPFSYEYGPVDLVDEQVDAVEAYLRDRYGYISRDMVLSRGRALAGAYRGAGPLTDCACDRLSARLAQKKAPKDLRAEEDLLRALAFLDRNQTDLYLREASMCIYGSSKYFEEHSLQNVSKFIREYHGEPCGDEEISAEILAEYRIRIRPQKLCVKGPLTLYLADGSRMEAGPLKKGVEFSAEDLDALRSVAVHADRFFTVENRAAYDRFRADGCAVFYLGGYVNRAQRDFLKMIKAGSPSLSFFHFGDIDAGGFYIHDDLCRKTDIAFEPWKMSAEVLRDPRYADCLQVLTARDRVRLAKLREDLRYRETVAYMLEQNVKLEQEIVCLAESLVT